MIPKGNFYFRRGLDHEDRLQIPKNVKRPLPILWCREGEFRLVSREIVSNAITTSDAISKMRDKAAHPIVYVYWDQGIPVINQVGNMLMGGL
jgi:hypothetical protein